jgi:hypothetical protein
MSQESAANPIEEIVEFFSQAPSREEIATFRLSDSSQDHIRALLHKNSDGTLTRDETHELDKIMALNDVISLIRARVRRSSGQLSAPSSRSNV